MEPRWLTSTGYLKLGYAPYVKVPVRVSVHHDKVGYTRVQVTRFQSPHVLLTFCLVSSSLGLSRAAKPGDGTGFLLEFGRFLGWNLAAAVIPSPRFVPSNVRVRHTISYYALLCASAQSTRMILAGVIQPTSSAEGKFRRLQPRPRPGSVSSL
jgi:hypothetical protein